MSDRARAWLAIRAGAVPPALEARMESAMDDVLEDDSIPAVLADAARVCLRDALAAGDDRSAALHLLAADALITYACEAAVDGDGDALRAIADANGPDRLAHLIDGAHIP
ncbi:MAG TPA: hypothetical protein VHG09_08310 [Longimicrobiales bacterium]|nr:hypothetical protein [Longimicrobiales bacterium]